MGLKKYKATHLRLLDRVIILSNTMRESSRISAFGFSKALKFAYENDNRFVLVTFLLLGFGVWWLIIPEALLV
ncbi:hypothetical protein AMTRI_Chr05g61950 [Amborella trichopoda]